MEHISSVIARVVADVPGCELPLGQMIAATDSPLESMLLAEIVRRVPDAWLTTPEVVERAACPELPGGSSEPIWAVRWSLATLYLHPRIGKWTPDFVFAATVVGSPTVRLAVECDGYEFHEKTREQAQRDRLKDRTLVRDGYIPVRFTGSEIFHSPTACVDEIFSIAADTIHCRREQRGA